MNNEQKPDAEGVERKPPMPSANDATKPAEPAAAGPEAAPDEIARLKAESADLKDRLLRAHAEMENVRKRLEKEKADTARFAITKFARDVVVIGDNVQRAIDAVPSHAAEHDPALKSFLEGVNMIEREFINVLDRHGVKRIDPKGEAFNPHLHQAVMEMPVPDVGLGDHHPGLPARLHDRGPRPPAGDGGRRQGRHEAAGRPQSAQSPGTQSPGMQAPVSPSNGEAPGQQPGPQDDGRPGEGSGSWGGGPGGPNT